ncbi:KH domain-containing protein [Helicobacter sp. MIT 99-5507]|uniref:KH domain-containing protein n=1 Tax=Helicobacter sp. MIT 99-5507 TaxID=152489 RepID=UPI000E1EAC27|nr:KH domain-containing protein [Helicobacter sp. MIT 99-5507]RDU57626.1 KH domain-containing protein [Helicobacter sp. MIT 99-5507]
MVDDFIKSYVKKIASHAEHISVTKSINSQDSSCDIVIYANSNDIGRIVGRNGKMISSIKTLISGCKAKDGISYKIVVESI